MKAIALTLATCAFLAGGCATGEANVATPEPASEREYPTGSNIPRKKNAPADANIPMGMGVRVQSRDDLERIQNMGGPRNPDSITGR
jgi:hypothetical protein